MQEIEVRTIAGVATRVVLPDHGDISVLELRQLLGREREGLEACKLYYNVRRWTPGNTRARRTQCQLLTWVLSQGTALEEQRRVADIGIAPGAFLVRSTRDVVVLLWRE
jgi:hypothetical protein